jgi:AcrR family transcriptional regulator
MPRESAARSRILSTAAGLFYAEGVRAVGVDRIIAEAGIAKATFYRHFPAKDDLVRAYLTEEHERQRDAYAELRRSVGDPRQALMVVFDVIVRNGENPAYRGCPFTNVAAEYPDPAHPVRQTARLYRRWLRDLFEGLLYEAGDPAPQATATVLLMVRDGIVVGSDLDSPRAPHSLVRDAVLRVLDGPRLGGAGAPVSSARG